jgi:hypothetical protein
VIAGVTTCRMKPSIPATHVPPFRIEPGARLIPVNDLVGLSSPASGFTILGAGKTAIDACLWLLDDGVPPGGVPLRDRESGRAGALAQHQERDPPRESHAHRTGPDRAGRWVHPG